MNNESGDIQGRKSVVNGLEFFQSRSVQGGSANFFLSLLGNLDLQISLFKLRGEVLPIFGWFC